MSNFLTSSIGKKVIMSLSGLFLISFLCVHLALNLLLIFDNSGALFNQGAHFMATNPINPSWLSGLSFTSFGLLY